jgi:paraquat-inducible protein A
MTTTLLENTADYIATADAHVADIIDSLTTTDFEQVAVHANTLHTKSALLSLDDIAQMALSIEKIAQDGSSTEIIQAILPTLQTAVANALEALHLDKEPVSLAKRHPRRTKFVIGALIIALSSFTAGIFLPFMTITQFLFFDNTVSILSGIGRLFSQSEYLLFVIILLFTIVTPMLKIGMIGAAWFYPKAEQSHYLKWVEKYGKWSMLDVLVVAVMMVLIKLDGVAKIEAHVGAYIFAASVLVTMILSDWLGRQLKKH